VLQVEAAQVAGPGLVHVGGGGAGFRGPQPQRRCVAIAGQALDLEPNQRALDQGEFAVVVDP
jgi:hypothetical protein